ncbi:myosin-9-like [Eleutherodactylus coqui]|uniref:myosin-9-like n=1 Tax=Eleutherodactylus coqui TaxID=57060 RepID=UPI00346247BF
MKSGCEQVTVRSEANAHVGFSTTMPLVIVRSSESKLELSEKTDSTKGAKKKKRKNASPSETNGVVSANSEVQSETDRQGLPRIQEEFAPMQAYIKFLEEARQTANEIYDAQLKKGMANLCPLGEEAKRQRLLAEEQTERILTEKESIRQETEQMKAENAALLKENERLERLAKEEADHWVLLELNHVVAIREISKRLEQTEKVKEILKNDCTELTHKVNVLLKDKQKSECQRDAVEKQLQVQIAEAGKVQTELSEKLNKLQMELEAQREES